MNFFLRLKKMDLQSAKPHSLIYKKLSTAPLSTTEKIYERARLKRARKERQAALDTVHENMTKHKPNLKYKDSIDSEESLQSFVDFFMSDNFKSYKTNPEDFKEIFGRLLKDPWLANQILNSLDETDPAVARTVAKEILKLADPQRKEKITHSRYSAKPFASLILDDIILAKKGSKEPRPIYDLNPDELATVGSILSIHHLNDDLLKQVIIHPTIQTYTLERIYYNLDPQNRKQFAPFFAQTANTSHDILNLIIDSPDSDAKTKETAANTLKLREKVGRKIYN